MTTSAATITPTSIPSTTIASYSPDGSDNTATRLTQFTAANPDTDSSRLAYIKIVNASASMPSALTRSNRMFSDINTQALSSSMQPYSPNSSMLQSLINQLIADGSQYTKFMISSHHVGRMERYQVMPTFGDNYALFFTGRQPMVGCLPVKNRA